MKEEVYKDEEMVDGVELGFDGKNGIEQVNFIEVEE